MGADCIEVRMRGKVGAAVIGSISGRRVRANDDLIARFRGAT